MKRDHFTQLPSSLELQEIIAAEVKRNLPEGKKEVHYIDFTPIIKLAEHFGLEAENFAVDLKREDLAEQDIFGRGKIFVEKLKEKFLNRELSADDIEVCNAAYDYLAEEDRPEHTDLIFVFGAKTPLRIEKAVELYKVGYSETILVSGRGPYYAEGQVATEAETYARIATESGVPADAVIVEDKSITIPDNVRGSLNLLDEKGISHKSVTLVNSPYTQRRGWAHFRKYLPDNIKLVRVNSGSGDLYKRDNWYKNPTGIDTVLSEYLKMKVAVTLNTA